MSKKRATFYHAGCPVCVEAETSIVSSLDDRQYELETIHLGSHKGRIKDAESFGVQSVPALVLDGKAFHINFGASIGDLK